MSNFVKIILGVVAFYAIAGLVGYSGDVMECGLKGLCLLVLIRTGMDFINKK